jgi:hypothetical protein
MSPTESDAWAPTSVFSFIKLHTTFYSTPSTFSSSFYSSVSKPCKQGEKKIKGKEKNAKLDEIKLLGRKGA